jgi:chromate transporter
MSEPREKNSLIGIFLIYLRLGCLCFGGPVAHMAYFKDEFVNRRGWLDDSRYAELLGLCQFVPGPSSSQLGFAIGWHRGGLSGACAAWLGFTLPSALLMIGFAYGLFALGDSFDAAPICLESPLPCSPPDWCSTCPVTLHRSAPF